MKELALHILDVAENGITAGADRICIIVEKDPAENRMTITIEDNGQGVPADVMKRITDPFYTTRTTRRVGLGLSLFENTARQCEGSMSVESEPGQGTRVTATFAYDHIDRPPLGDMSATLMTLIYGNPEGDIVYRYRSESEEIVIDTKAIRERFGNRPITDPDVFRCLMDQMEQIKTVR
ncbi:MAG: ATP-binding protein [Desulfobacterales bacterium]|nr:ATP-binding protein [Desulfobacterales bacterium]